MHSRIPVPLTRDSIHHGAGVAQPRAVRNTPLQRARPQQAASGEVVCSRGDVD